LDHRSRRHCTDPRGSTQLGRELDITDHPARRPSIGGIAGDQGTILTEAYWDRIEDLEREDPFRLQVAETQEGPLVVALLDKGSSEERGLIDERLGAADVPRPHDRG